MSTSLRDILAKALEKPRNLSQDELAGLLSVSSPEEVDLLRSAAYSLKERIFGRRVAIRGIVEIGNRCAKDCLYCGIRRSNGSVERYCLGIDDIERMARTNSELRYKSIVLQGGELESEANTAFVEEVLERISRFSLGVTLSLGEQEKSVYARWKNAGASRYLLRIESSSRRIYESIHPEGYSWERRVKCLEALHGCGYQVGTGTMSALPGQSVGDLAADIVFFGRVDAHMIGMGPYIPHPETPLAKLDAGYSPSERLAIALNMISATRLYLHDVNIASTTALEALAPDGREQGVLAGANVVMPNVTDVEYRKGYQLYSGKPGLSETSLAAKASLERRLEAIGESIDYATRGDSPHFHAG